MVRECELLTGYATSVFDNQVDLAERQKHHSELIT
jgi:hypothetical protein